MCATGELRPVNREVSGSVGVLRAVVHGVQSDRITFIAASLAYYAFVSLMPLLLLVIVAVSVLGGPEIAGRLGARVGETLTPEIGELVQGALTNASGRGGATVVGIAVLLWTALKLFRGMDVAFSTVYGTAAQETLLDQIRDGSVTLVGVGLGIAVTVGMAIAATRITGLVGGSVLLSLIITLLMLPGLTLAFLPLYYVLPDTSGVTIREALPGAAFAAVGWTLLQTGFRVYAGAAGTYEAYGILGGVLLLMTFLYAGGLVLLVGVVLNAVLAGRIDDETDLELPPDAREAVEHQEREGQQLSLGGATDGIDVADDDDLEAQVRDLRSEIAAFEEEIDERTVHREEIERDLRRYVKSRVRSGKARGWGPYLVLLYGTAMTVGAFFFLSGGWAILAMLVVWLSTLGLYVLMVLLGAMLGIAGLPGELRDRISDARQ